MKTYDFTANYDVVVAGAGVAGVAAALASARRGLKTALVEKTVLNGGLATIGSVLYYLPISDGQNQQITFGISEELLLASTKYGPGDVPDWKHGKARYGVTFNPMSFVMAMDELLENAGVVCWYDSLLCGVERNNASGKVDGIVIENKSGRGCVYAKAFVDCTGDADIAWRAGTPTVDGVNYIAIWGMGYSMDAAKKAVENNDGTPLAQLIGWGCSDTGAGKIDGIDSFVGINGKDVSRFIVQSRGLARKSYSEEQAKYGRKALFPAMLPGMANYRMSRRIDAMLNLTTADMFTQFRDTVAVSCDWRGGYANNIWGLPYRSLLPKGLPGVLAAGRCAGTEGEAWQVYRVIPTAAQTGEVAGLAAAMSAERNVLPENLSTDDLRTELKKLGHLLDIREIPHLISPVKVSDL